jgi:hypothetical protein
MLYVPTYGLDERLWTLAAVAEAWSSASEGGAGVAV